MPNQNDFYRINIHVKQQLLRIYGGKLEDAFVEALVEHLARFNDETLKAAVKDVIASCKRLPTIAHLVEACRNHVPPATHRPEAEADFPWQVAERNAARLASAFMTEFASKPLAMQAYSEGWSQQLHAYAWDAASFQAALIAGLRNAGYSNAVLCWDALTSDMPTIRKRRVEFESACRRQAGTGTIVVDVPSDAIARWRERAARRAARTA